MQRVDTLRSLVMERKVVSNGLWLSNLDIVDVVQHYCLIESSG